MPFTFRQVVYLLFLSALMPSTVTYGQLFRFSFDGDSITVPYLHDSLRGISGIDYVPALNEWHMVSDRGPHFTFTNLRTLRDFSDPSRLTNIQRTPYWHESIRFDATGTYFFFAEEYKHVTSVVVGRRDNSERKVLLSIPLPEDNKGIEGLAVSPSGALWVAPEAGWEGEANLTQDTVTFFRFQRPLDADRVAERFRYPITRYPLAENGERFGGISEILSVDDNTLLVLERCYIKSQQQVVAKLYLATISPDTKTLTRTLAFDFNSQFPGPVCNLECMAWLDAQQQTLVLMADDNFSRSKTQRNQLIFLKRKE